MTEEKMKEKLVVYEALKKARQKIMCKRYSTKVKNGALWEAHNMVFPLSSSVPAGWGGMRAARGVNAAPFRQEDYDKREINRSSDLRIGAPAG